MIDAEEGTFRDIRALKTYPVVSDPHIVFVIEVVDSTENLIMIV